MHGARDAEDTRLLEAGEKALLLEGYYGVIIDRCRLEVRDDERALDVAHEVVLRLLSEFARGRRYRVPFRIAVHKVIEWAMKGLYERGRAILTELRKPLDASLITLKEIGDMPSKLGSCSKSGSRSARASPPPSSTRTSAVS